MGVPKKDKKKIRDHIVATKILRDHGLKGSGIVGAYHLRRAAPLMARMLLLPQMVPGELLEGTMLAKEALANTEVTQCIKEAMKSVKDSTGVTLDFVFPVPRVSPNAAGAWLR